MFILIPTVKLSNKQTNGRADPNQAVTTGISDPHSIRRSFPRDSRPMREPTYVPETDHFIAN